jgi:hypothetical protein
VLTLGLTTHKLRHVLLQGTVIAYLFNSPEAEVWQQVISDLTEAANRLPASYEASELGRITKGGAHALLGKAYMQAKDFAAAKNALDYLVIGEGANNYDLVADYYDNFKVTTEFNVESVIEWSYIENPTEGTDNDAATPNHNFGTSIGQFYAPPGVGFSDGEALRWVVGEFEKERTLADERDPRLPVTFLYDFTDERGPAFTMVYGLTFEERYGNNNRVFFRKFLSDHFKNEEGFRGINNYRFIRYADVLLMYAECLNETGNTEQAYPLCRQSEGAGWPRSIVYSPTRIRSTSFFGTNKARKAS